MARAVKGVLLVFLAAVPAWARHEIPSNVTARVWIHPEGERLRVLVRAPLEAVHDVEWPTRGPGYLELDRLESPLAGAARVWLVDPMEIDEDGRVLDPPEIVRVRASLPSDPAFTAYETAVAHVRGPGLDPGLDLYWSQALVDVELEYAIRSESARFALRPGFERLGLRVTTLVGFRSPDGAERVFHLDGDPGRVVLAPRWYQASSTFVRMGFGHILGGIDHLLFLLCLVIPIRKFRPLVVVVTAFTVAHSITLLASAYGMTPSALWFPPFVETAIAASILAMAIGNIIRPEGGYRWVMAFAFGLVHGFGFSFALGDTLALAGDHAVAALFAFNAGVELGQLAVLALLVPAVWTFLKLGTSERIATIVLSVLAGHAAWHWMIERGTAFSVYVAPAGFGPFG